MRVLLLDGYNLIYRAWHSAGRRPGDFTTVFGFMRSLRVLIEQFEPDKAYFVIEGMPKHRYALAEDYKATRKSSPDRFHRQKRLIIDLIKYDLPIEVVQHADFECDDVIYNLVHQHQDDNCTVVSTDTDFLQLYNEFAVEVYNPVKKTNQEPVEYDYVRWKALRGDTADNVAGFRGIGDKRALKLINDEDALQSFLNSQPEGQSRFKTNQDLIRFAKIRGQEWESTNRWNTFTGFDELYSKFLEMKFFSITNDKSWSKFRGTFQSLV